MLLRVLLIPLLVLHVTADSSKSEEEDGAEKLLTSENLVAVKKRSPMDPPLFIPRDEFFNPKQEVQLTDIHGKPVAKREIHVKSFSEEKRDLELAWASFDADEQEAEKHQLGSSVTTEVVEESSTEEKEEVEGSGTVEKRSADEDNDAAQSLLTSENLVAVKKRTPVYVPSDEFFNPKQELQLTDIHGKPVSKRNIGVSLYEEVMNRPRWSDEEKVDERERNREKPVLSDDNGTEDSTLQGLAGDNDGRLIIAEDVVEGSGTMEKESSESDVEKRSMSNDAIWKRAAAVADEKGFLRKKRSLEPPKFVSNNEYFAPEPKIVAPENWGKRAAGFLTEGSIVKRQADSFPQQPEQVILGNEQPVAMAQRWPGRRDSDNTDDSDERRGRPGRPGSRPDQPNPPRPSPTPPSVTPTPPPRPQQPSCETVRCRDGTQCVMERGEPTCKPNQQPIPPPPSQQQRSCRDIDCPWGSRCRMERDSRCSSRFCPEIPVCFRDSSSSSHSSHVSCRSVQCPFGTSCRVNQDPSCRGFNCREIATCVNPCDSIRCGFGSVCRVINGQDAVCTQITIDPCLTARCPANYQCRADGSTPMCYPSFAAPAPQPSPPTTPAPSPNTCVGANEQFASCATYCEPTCIEKTPACVMACAAPRCQCAAGFYRNNQGVCVAAHQCEVTPQCPVNQVWNGCGAACENTCGNPENMICPTICLPGACHCKPGFWRHRSGACVQQQQCFQG